MSEQYDVINGSGNHQGGGVIWASGIYAARETIFDGGVER